MEKKKPEGNPVNPTLIKAADEIKAILKKHDIGGVAILHTPGFVQFTMHVEPSYSIAKMEGKNITIKSDKVIGGLGANDTKIKMRDTANMIGNFRVLCQQLFTGFLMTERAIREKYPDFFPKQPPPSNGLVGPDGSTPLNNPSL